MTLGKNIETRERISTSKSGSPTTKRAELAQKAPKIIPKISLSALSGDPTDVTLATNHSIFRKKNLNKVIRDQEGAPRSQRGSLATKVASII